MLRASIFCSAIGLLLPIACSAGGGSSGIPTDGASGATNDDHDDERDGGVRNVATDAGKTDAAKTQKDGATLTDSATSTDECADDEVMCPKGCANLDDDPDNCGSCGVKCTAPPGVTRACVSGQCTQTCGGGKTVCNAGNTATCVDLKNDIDNCGKCGTQCQASGVAATCTNGVCGAACPAGKTFCGGTCIDTQSDPNNCGACGALCSTRLANKYPGATLFGTLSCVAGGCQLAVDTDVGVNCASGDCTKSCETICRDRTKVGCNATKPPFGCSGTSGACGSYSQQFGTGFVSCEQTFSCTSTVAGSRKCSGSQVFIPLTSVSCQCTGVLSY